MARVKIVYAEMHRYELEIDWPGWSGGELSNDVFEKVSEHEDERIETDVYYDELLSVTEVTN